VIAGGIRGLTLRLARVAVLLWCSVSLWTPSAGAQGIIAAQTIIEDGVVTRKEAAPQRLTGIDIEEHLDRLLPLDLSFTDTHGQVVSLSKFVNGQRPVIFTLNYSDCPMLCSLMLNGLATTLTKIERQLGRDFEVVTVSLNPLETSERAAQTQARYEAEVGRPEAVGAWHFLTGTKQNIDSLADALGVRYGYNEERKEYVHPAALIISTPAGHISRYLYGIEYHPKTLSLSLVEAAQGKIGTSVDRLILYCFHYDENEGRYAPVAMNIMRVGGGLTVLGLAGFLGAYWFRGRHRRDSGGVLAGLGGEGGRLIPRSRRRSPVQDVGS
jgi:protein SCO1/2